MDDNQAIERAAIANEVWGTAEHSPVEPVAKVEEVAEPIAETAPADQEIDPWAGIPAALREEVEGLRAKVGNLEKIDFRLKQTESRLGSVQNELHAAKEAAKAVADAPSKEKIAEAATSLGEWNALKEAYPEWAKATEGRIAAERAEILKQLPNIDSIREELKTASTSELEKVKNELAGYHVAAKHPDWMTTRDSAEFKQWNEKQGNKDSFNPLEVIAIMDDYAKYQSTRKTPTQIAAERQERLKASQTTEGHRLPPKKSEADMTATEMRSAIAKQVWG